MHDSNKSIGHHQKPGAVLCCNAHMAAKPLLRLSQVVGLAPVGWPDLRPSTFGTIYTCAISAVLLAWFIYTTRLDILNEYPGKVATFIVPDLFNSAAIYITSLASLVMCATSSRHKPRIVMRLFAQADEILMNDSSNSAHNKAKLVITAKLISVVSVLTLLAVYDNYVWTGRLWNFNDYTGRYLAHLVNTVLVLQFSSLALLLKQRFAKLNVLLKSTVPGFICHHQGRLLNALTPSPRTKLRIGVHSDRETTGVVTPGNGPPRARPGVFAIAVHPMPGSGGSTSQHDLQLLALRRTHAILCEVASAVNSMYGVQIMLAITSDFIGLVWLLYLLLVATLVSEMTDRTQQSVSMSVLWLLYRSLKIMTVVSACHMAQTEARRTGALVHQVLIQEETLRGAGSSYSLLQLQRFSQQLLHCRDQMDFTACGLFPLDMTLLHSVIGAVTTYIIILMQFHTK